MINTERAHVKAIGTVSSTALLLEDLSFTPDEVNASSIMRLSVETAGIRYWYDGSTPTASEGHPLAAGAELILMGRRNIQQFRMIRSSGSNATVMVTLEK